MPIIMPIKELRDTMNISEIAHKKQEPIFITKNGYSDLVVMSSELYDRLAGSSRIDQAVCEAEREYEADGEQYDVNDVFSALNRKYYGKV